MCWSLPPRLGRQEEDRIGDAQAADVVELLLDEAPVVPAQGIEDREEDEAFGVPFLQALRAVRQPRPERFGDRLDLAFAEVQPVPSFCDSGQQEILREQCPGGHLPTPRFAVPVVAILRCNVI